MTSLVGVVLLVLAVGLVLLWFTYAFFLICSGKTESKPKPQPPVPHKFTDDSHEAFLHDFNHLINKTEVAVSTKQAGYKDRIARRVLGQGAKTLLAHAKELEAKCQKAFDNWEAMHSGIVEGTPHYPNWTYSWEVIKDRARAIEAIKEKRCSRDYIKQFDLKAEMLSLRHRAAAYIWACRRNESPKYDTGILFGNFHPYLKDSAANRGGVPTGGYRPSPLNHSQNRGYTYPQNHHYTPLPVKPAIEVRREKLLANRKKPSVAAVVAPVATTPPI